jgi:hypothetical protein
VGYLNDSSELSYGFGILREELRRRENNAPSEPERLLWSRLGDELVRTSLSDSEFYITCFCTEGNLLSQWRGYGTSSGYAVGFRTLTLMQSTEATAFASVKEMFPAHEQAESEHPVSLSAQPVSRTVERLLAPVLVPVSYNAYEQQKLFGRILDCADAAPVRALQSNETELTVERVAGALKHAIAAALISMKHPSFAPEAEWRLVYWDREKNGGFRADSLLSFRANTKHLVPYLDVGLRVLSGHPLGLLPVDSVTVGPTATPKLAAEAVKALLHQHGYTAVPVDSSDIPLRE